MLQHSALEGPASVCIIKAQNQHTHTHIQYQNLKQILSKYNGIISTIGGNKKKMKEGDCWEMDKYKAHWIQVLSTDDIQHHHEREISENTR